MRWLQLGIRSLLAVVLLYFIWRNSHWSVAISLTLIIAAIEIANQNRLNIIKEVKRIDNQETGGG